jgi:hypothetical protein
MPNTPSANGMKFFSPTAKTVNSSLNLSDAAMPAGHALGRKEHKSALISRPDVHCNSHRFGSWLPLVHSPLYRFTNQPIFGAQ